MINNAINNTICLLLKILLHEVKQFSDSPLNHERKSGMRGRERERHGERERSKIKDEKSLKLLTIATTNGLSPQTVANVMMNIWHEP